MKRTLAAFLLLSLASGCSVKQEPRPVATSTAPAPVAATSSPQSWATPDPTPQSSDFLIIPGKSVGEIGRSSTYESLVKTYGERNVLKTKLYVGEGMEKEGVTVFPDDKTTMVEIFWWDEDPSVVQMIRIQGENSKWHTPQGVTLGTTVKDLERLNEKPFKLLGLGWDYGGSVTNWNGGALDGLHARVQAGADSNVGEEAFAEIMGDKEIESSNSVLQEVNPTVFEIAVQFPLSE